MPEHETAAELHERLRLIALEMHGLVGFADACEDAGDLADAEQVRDAIAKVRALIPDTADPAAFKFAWGVRFTARDGHRNNLPARDEADARDLLDYQRQQVNPENAHRYELCRRAVGGWEVVDA
jgi:hypothetical protein